MKKVTETITLNEGQRKKVTLKIDEQIYEALMQTGDRAIYEAYLAEEYNTRCLERRASDNCTSLDVILDKGHDFADKTVNPVRDVIRAEQKRIVASALDKLTARQRIVVTMHLMEEMSMGEIAEELGISKATVWEIYHAAEKKLENFLEIP